MKILLVVNTSKEEACRCADRADQVLSQSGAICIRCAADTLAHQVAAIQDCDIVVTVGGDGTLLHAAAWAARWDKPVLGVNVGRVGFLATVEETELEQLARLAKGSYVLDRRLMLHAQISGEHAYQNDALNDVVISKGIGANTIRFEVYCDDILVNSYRGDGVILATPTGSTAYSLSAGGPILDAEIRGILVTPICAHSLNTPPMVFSADRNIRIVTSEYGTVGGAYLSADGRDSIALSPKDEIQIGVSTKSLSLVSFCRADQFQAIDKKLKGR